MNKAMAKGKAQISDQPADEEIIKQRVDLCSVVVGKGVKTVDDYILCYSSISM